MEDPKPEILAALDTSHERHDRRPSFDVYLHNDPQGDEAPPWAVALKKQMRLLIEKMESLMATSAELIAAVREQTTVIGGLTVYVNGIETKIDELEQTIKDLLSGIVIPAAVQADIDTAFAETKMNTTAVLEAATANVPPVEPPVGGAARRTMNPDGSVSYTVNKQGIATDADGFRVNSKGDRV